MQNQNGNINALLGNTDIYLIDQVMKGRYRSTDVLLDAGCGGGRNLPWFINNDIDVYAVDVNEQAIKQLKSIYNHLPAERFNVAAVENVPFNDNYFDAIICSAVLHFARSEEHLFAMLKELLRVLKVGGNLFIRMASNIGIETKVERLQNGVYALPDGTNRFLLTRSILATIMQQFPVSYLESFKTVNVNDVRCMSTLVLEKK